MFRRAALFASLAAVAFAAPASAQSLSLVQLPVVFVSAPVVQQAHKGQRLAPQAAVLAPETAFAQSHRREFPPAAAPAPLWRAPASVDRAPRDYNRGIADYGPFRVLDSGRVALLGETDAASPRWFKAMLRDHPGLRQIDLVECPGTQDDRANLAVGRLIHAAGMATFVPAIGSVRSGAVELFFAGATRDIADGAEFAVHSWRDPYGREASDFSDDAPENRRYLDYYREMGLSDAQARAFYRFTNSVPHREALWLGARDMRRWTAAPAQAQASVRRERALRQPRIEYDVTFS